MVPDCCYGVPGEGWGWGGWQGGEMHSCSQLYIICYIKRNENLLRREALAKKLSNGNTDEFWKEIHAINNCNTPQPDTINNVSGSENILELWRKHFYDIFNCLQKLSIDKSKILLASSHNEDLVTTDKIRQTINK